MTRLVLVVAFVFVTSVAGLAQTIHEFQTDSFSRAAPGIVLGPDGAMWFASDSLARVGRIDSTGQVTTFALNSGSSSITNGPDGNLWLTMWDDSVVRLSVTGSVSKFHLPTANPSPWGIVTGPDGNLWITEFAANRIARVSPDGTAVEFVIPTPATFPTNIAVGPDGALWFSERSTRKIGRITTAGSITEFSLNSLAYASSIATGPDGNLWFTRPLANMISRITTTGVVTDFLLPGPGSFPSQIVAGPDGAMWFTETAASKIGRISMTGEVAEFRIPTYCPGLFPQEPSCQPDAIARGPRGDLWFTEVTGLGQVELGPGSCTVTAGRACLNGARFEVSVQWDVPELGTSGSGSTVQLTADSAYFWFFTANNAELLVKVVDGRAFNNKFWVFYGGLSNVHYTITVRDSVTGAVRTYVNPDHALTSGADTAAFSP